MRIYITGIAGMLGSNIAYELRDNYEICGADLIGINMLYVKSEIFDLSNENLLNESIVRNNPDIIIHTAAAVNVDQCEMDRAFADKLNYSLTSTLARICKNRRIQLIYVSTDAVFDGESENLYTEEDYTNPINYYGITKLAGEKKVLESKLNTVLRTNIYGFNIQDKYSFGEWILYSLLENKNLNMFTDIYFSPILVNELAKIIDFIITNKVYGLYHACATGVISKYEFGIKMKEIFGIESGAIDSTLSTQFSFKAKRAKNMGMSNEKLSKKLNFSISTPIESIEKFKKLYQNGFPKKLKSMR